MEGEFWGLHNTGQTGGTSDIDIDAPEAWDMTTGSSGLIVAVIDTGIEYDHPDLADNMWVNPDETVDFMAKVDKPWIAFKTLAAGAIPPRMGFSSAFRNGADFICAGMFDFQVAEDVKVALDAIAKCEQRKRPWLA